MFGDSDGVGRRGLPVVLDRLRSFEQTMHSRSKNARRRDRKPDYNLIENEIFVTFATAERIPRGPRLPFFPPPGRAPVEAMTFETTLIRLRKIRGIGIAAMATKP